jgi:putative ABC transport system permease protein
MTYLWLRTWRLGVKSLLLHPLRSWLTVSGIFIGVASVVWLLAIGEGISQNAQRQIEDLGANNIIVRSVLPAEEALTDTGFFVHYGLLRSDYDCLVETIPTIQHALRIRELKTGVYYGPNLVDARLVGCTPEYAEVMKLELARGHFLSQVEMDNEEHVCVLAASVAKELFPLENPIGRTVRVEYLPYVVVGVMKPRNPMAGIGGSLSSQDFNMDVYVPVTTLWRRVGDWVQTRRGGSRTGEVVELSQITFQARRLADVVPTATAIKNVMATRHKTEDYAIVIPLELLEQARTTRLMFMLFMGLIAAISLLVGGIGIMNIMLATVTERTREVGIRRALGAKRSDITRQFLVETIALSVIGGATGILGGLTCPWFVGWIRGGAQIAFPNVMQSLPELVRDVTPQVVPWSVPLAFGISVVVGVVFGIYPAMRAAMMDPIEALRHE